MPRFSLRSFLLFVVALSVLLGWVGKLCLRTRQQRAIIAQIKQAGGAAYYQAPGADTNQPTPPPGPFLLRQIVGDEAFSDVRLVSFPRIANANDDALRVLFRLPELRTVIIGGKRLTDSGIDCLAKIPKLRALNISVSDNITANGLEKLAAASELRELSLGELEINDIVVQGLAELKQLTSLQLFRTSVTGRGLAPLAKLTRLEEINFLGSATIDEGALRNLAELPNLRSLMLCGTSVGDADLAELRKFRSLEGLNLQGTKVTDASMPHLADCQALKSLALGGAISDRGVESLRKLKKLELLWIDSSAVTDESTATFAGFENLNELLLNRTAITDVGARRLGQLKHLGKLWLGANVTADAAADLRTSLPQCEIELYDATGKQRPSN